MPSFYILTMIIPIWLIFCLSIFVFYLPAEAGEKMTLSISILIGQTVFLTLLGNRVPETSVEIPLLGGKGSKSVATRINNYLIIRHFKFDLYFNNNRIPGFLSNKTSSPG